MDDQFQYPPKSGEYLPPQQPTYQVTSDIPPTSPYHQSPQPRSSNRQAAGWLTGLGAAFVAFIKYGGLFLLKFPALATVLSALVSFAVYAVWFNGVAFAAGLVVMIFIHEMGHVVEIRRQGMAATAPIFIPLFGAAIFQRQHPTTAVKQAQIGIAGPIAGTIGATVAYFLYLSTGWDVLLLAALTGFGLNLFNMIPVWQLDGSWILAPVSKWLFVAGYAVAVGAVIYFHSIFLGMLLLLGGMSSLIQRFQTAGSPYYTSVPATSRWALAGAWIALVAYLGFMLAQAYALLNPLVQ
jgi:Zn-dependent protease